MLSSFARRFSHHRLPITTASKSPTFVVSNSQQTGVLDFDCIGAQGIPISGWGFRVVPADFRKVSETIQASIMRTSRPSLGLDSIRMSSAMEVSATSAADSVRRASLFPFRSTCHMITRRRSGGWGSAQLCGQSVSDSHGSTLASVLAQQMPLQEPPRDLSFVSSKSGFQLWYCSQRILDAPLAFPNFDRGRQSPRRARGFSVVVQAWPQSSCLAPTSFRFEAPARPTPPHSRSPTARRSPRASLLRIGRRSDAPYASTIR